MIDFHTHVLHSIDDGPVNITESLSLIYELKSQGINKIVCTPHFNPAKRNIDEFIKNRDFLMKELRNSISPALDIELINGCELYLDDSILYSADIQKLCIQSTNLILLELPINIKWSKHLRKSIESFIIKKSLRVIIAHAERYANLHKHSYKYIRELIDMDCIIQINCDFVSEKIKSSAALDMLKSGLVHLIATDCHGINRRPPEFKKAEEIITLNFSKNTFQNLQENANKLISNKSLKSSNLFF